MMQLSILFYGVFFLFNGFQDEISFNKNPISFEYQYDVSEVKKAIEATLGDKQFYGMKMYTYKALPAYMQDEFMINETFTNMDAYFLYDTKLVKLANSKISVNAICESKTHIYENRPVIYDAIFIVHLVTVSKNKTRVSIGTPKSKIYFGKELYFNWHNLFHFGPSVKAISPTTIEEYQILLRIGEALGVKDQMLPLILPEKTKL